MLRYMDRGPAPSAPRRGLRSARAAVGCESLETRALLSRGMGMEAFGGMGGHRSVMAELGPFGGGGANAMFGAGSLGLGGGTRDPIFLLTASLLNTGSGTSPTRGELSSSAVQSAFKTLQTDLNDNITVGARPTHASVGQLQDDLGSIRKGTLTGSDATTAIQNDEAAILTSMGLSSTQVSQIQSDLQAVQSAIQSASSSGTGTTTSTNGTSSSTTGSTTTTTTSTGSTTSTDTGSTTGTASTATTGSAVQTALQTLQTDVNNDTPVDAQPTHASVGQLQDDLDAIGKGTLTGSQAVTTVQTDAAAVFSSEGLTQSQITQIQSDQAALATAIQANQGSSSDSTSSTSSSSASTGSSSASPTSIAGVQATMQSVKAYLVGVPGVGPAGMGGIVASGGGGVGGPIFISRGDGGINPGGPMLQATGGAGGSAARAINPGGPMIPSTGGAAGSGAGGSAAGGPMVLSTAAGGAGGPIMVGSGGLLSGLKSPNFGGFGGGPGG